jgi:2-dehydro-3-deoxygalactonokinase
LPNVEKAAIPGLIAVDWGTTSFRAYLVSANGAIIDRVESTRGIQSVGAGDYEQVLISSLSAWRDVAAPPPIILSGMIGSRQGWVEAPYVSCPAGLAETAAAIVTIKSAAFGEIGVVPGVLADGDPEGPDVMRGEETQIFGALAASSGEDGVFVLPGTHSKWAIVEKGRIVSFKTYMTGDAFGALRNHTILARLMDGPEADGEGFALGVKAARGLKAPGDLLHAIFMARTLGLFERLRSAQLPEYLSGLLIGAELLAAAPRDGAAATIIGSASLTRRYRQAGEILGVALEAAPEDCTVLGQHALFTKWRGLAFSQST